MKTVYTEFYWIARNLGKIVLTDYQTVNVISTFYHDNSPKSIAQVEGEIDNMVVSEGWTRVFFVEEYDLL